MLMRGGYKGFSEDFLFAPLANSVHVYIRARFVGNER